jgi:methylphosphotriester-DNA--protein-cysteine methyltransferase
MPVVTVNNNQKHGLFFKTANPRHLQDYPGIFAVQQEHKIKDGRELVSNLAFKPAVMSDIYARLSLSSSCAEQLFLKAFGITPVGLPDATAHGARQRVARGLTP